MSEWQTTASIDVGVERSRPALDAGVAEPVDRERRLVDLVVAAGEHVGVGGRGRAQQPHGQLALVEDLGVAQRDLVAGRHRAP